MWLPLLGCLFIIRYYSHDPSVLETGVILSSFSGIFLLGCLYMAMGCFASSLTKNQIIASMVSIALGGSLFVLSFLSLSYAQEGGLKAQLFNHVGMFEHMQDFGRGVMDTRPLVFYSTFTFFFLFLTWKVVESRRWK
jgi:ABC-2 type transport system permease protein